jgi:hypothetical protein
MGFEVEQIFKKLMTFHKLSTKIRKAFHKEICLSGNEYLGYDYFIWNVKMVKQVQPVLHGKHIKIVSADYKLIPLQR